MTFLEDFDVDAAVVLKLFLLIDIAALLVKDFWCCLVVCCMSLLEQLLCKFYKCECKACGSCEIVVSYFLHRIFSIYVWKLKFTRYFENMGLSRTFPKELIIESKYCTLWNLTKQSIQKKMTIEVDTTTLEIRKIIEAFCYQQVQHVGNSLKKYFDPHSRTLETQSPSTRSNPKT